jgi:hypothetical protein
MNPLPSSKPVAETMCGKKEAIRAVACPCAEVVYRASVSPAESSVTLYAARSNKSNIRGIPPATQCDFFCGYILFIVVSYQAKKFCSCRKKSNQY